MFQVICGRRKSFVYSNTLIGFDFSDIVLYRKFRTFTCSVTQMNPNEKNATKMKMIITKAKWKQCLMKVSTKMVEFKFE